jgi:hypothetical protein
MAQVRELLERYAEAKDLTRPALMPAIYAPDALLSFSIATDEIHFPGEVRGLEAITRTLVSEFGERFVRCRTYYLCDDPPPQDDGILFLPWFVAMREPGAGALRLGKGCYRWQFERHHGTRSRVRAMHIFIARMATVPDPGGALLACVQRDLPYPWLTPAVLRSITGQALEREPALGLLREFREPVAWPDAVA